MPVSSLQHPTTVHNTFGASDIVSTLQTIAISLKDYSVLTEQLTVTDFAWMASIKFQLVVAVWRGGRPERIFFPHVST